MTFVVKFDIIPSMKGKDDINNNSISGFGRDVTSLEKVRKGVR